MGNGGIIGTLVTVAVAGKVVRDLKKKPFTQKCKPPCHTFKSHHRK